MQPYQKAAQEVRRQGELPIKAAGLVGSAAATLGSAYLGGAALNRVLPFLNKYIPEDLAIKGLSKIDPRFGTFINKALRAGKSFDETKDFIKEKIEESTNPPKIDVEKEKESPGKQLAQFSDKLANFIEKSLAQGIPISRAAFLAKHHPDFVRDVIDIEKNNNMTFLDFINKLYGAKKKEKPTQNIQSSNVQTGEGKAALMQAMQALSQQLKQ